MGREELYRDRRDSYIMSRTRVTRENLGLHDEFWPYDNLKDRVYGQVAGGIAWPSGNKEGAVVVAAAQRPVRGIVHHYVIGFEQDHDYGRLIDHALKLNRDLMLSDGLFYIDAGNETALEFLKYRRRSATDKSAGVLQYSGMALPENGSIEKYLHLLRDALRSEQRTVWLDEFPVLTNILDELPADISQMKVGDNPPVTALCFALHNMLMNPITHESEVLKRRRRTRNKSNYNPLEHFNKVK
jgi:hypothetical protein